MIQFEGILKESKLIFQVFGVLLMIVERLEAKSLTAVVHGLFKTKFELFDKKIEEESSV